jgi:hypothetical protein
VIRLIATNCHFAPADRGDGDAADVQRFGHPRLKQLGTTA